MQLARGARCDIGAFYTVLLLLTVQKLHIYLIFNFYYFSKTNFKVKIREPYSLSLFTQT